MADHKMASFAFWTRRISRVDGEIGLSWKVASILLAGGAMLASLCLTARSARADSVTAGLTTPTVPATGTQTVIDLSGITAPSQSTITGAGYTISFSNVGAQQGVVQGTLASEHFVPVAGSIGSQPEYLTNGYGSALTSNIAASGNYFATGFGTITITFSQPQNSLTLLWGSDDAGNMLSLNDAANFSLTGLQFANDFYSEGYTTVPLGNSAYLAIDTSTPFTTVTASTSLATFEFAGVAASTGSLAIPSPVPEPATEVLVTFGIGLVAVFGIRRSNASH